MWVSIPSFYAEVLSSEEDKVAAHRAQRRQEHSSRGQDSRRPFSKCPRVKARAERARAAPAERLHEGCAMPPWVVHSALVPTRPDCRLRSLPSGPRLPAPRRRALLSRSRRRQPSVAQRILAPQAWSKPHAWSKLRHHGHQPWQTPHDACRVHSSPVWVWGEWLAERRRRGGRRRRPGRRRRGAKRRRGGGELHGRLQPRGRQHGALHAKAGPAGSVWRYMQSLPCMQMGPSISSLLRRLSVSSLLRRACLAQGVSCAHAASRSGMRRVALTL